MEPEAVCQEIVNDLPEKLQIFLKESKKIYSFSHIAPGRYDAKEEYRGNIVFKQTGRNYQRKKR